MMLSISLPFPSFFLSPPFSSLPFILPLLLHSVSDSVLPDLPANMAPFFLVWITFCLIKEKSELKPSETKSSSMLYHSKIYSRAPKAVIMLQRT